MRCLHAFFARTAITHCFGMRLPWNAIACCACVFHTTHMQSKYSCSVIATTHLLYTRLTCTVCTAAAWSPRLICYTHGSHAQYAQLQRDHQNSHATHTAHMHSMHSCNVIARTRLLQTRLTCTVCTAATWSPELACYRHGSHAQYAQLQSDRQDSPATHTAHMHSMHSCSVIARTQWMVNTRHYRGVQNVSCIDMLSASGIGYLNIDVSEIIYICIFR